MGWNSSFLARTSRLSGLLLAGAVLTGAVSGAQVLTPDPFPCNQYSFYTGTSVNDELLTLCNGWLAVTYGVGSNQGSSIGLWTTGSNTSDPSQALLWYGPEVPTSTVTAGAYPPYAPVSVFAGSHVYLRVDGGKLSGQLTGYDYDIGNITDTVSGEWLEVPQIVGNHIEARWITSPAVTYTYPFPLPTTATGGTGTGGTGTGGTGTGGTGTGGTGTTGGLVLNPNIEVDIKISFVHDQARFEFDIINQDIGVAHSVGLAFVQAINPNTNGYGEPIQVNNGPNITQEVVYSGAQVPATYATQQTVSAGTPATGKQPVVHSLLGSLRPTATSATGGAPGTSGPTPPTRFIVGSAYNPGVGLSGAASTEGDLNGNYAVVEPVRQYEYLWNYVANPKVSFGPTAPFDEAVGLLWDPQSISVGQTLPLVTYIGGDSATHDFGSPMSLSVSAPQALVLQTSTSAGTSTNQPSPFTINAYVTNTSDLLASGGVTLAPVSLQISLPKGLVLVNDTVSKTISSVAPGAEGATSWTVQADGTVSGNLQYTVTSSALNFGTGKIVQRSIEVPAQPTIPLKTASQNGGLYQMVTFPFLFGSATPTQILFPNLDANTFPVDIAYWSPTNGNYASTNSFTPGNGYWVRNRENVAPSPINTALYPPVANQINPGSTPYTVSYAQGWNQIGSPYIYEFPFSNLQVFDTSTLTLYTMAEAADPSANLILPAVYYYDTSNADPTQWQYQMITNFGFNMEPYLGYWIYVKQPNLQFIYTGIDTPGAAIVTTKSVRSTATTRATSQPGKATNNNWMLRLAATGASGTDQYNYIGVAPNATDNLDAYKYVKPPVMNNQLTLDIVHSNWSEGTRYSQDLRSATPTPKTWDLTVKSAKPNENVTITWPGLNGSVPSKTQLSLVDATTNTTINLRSRSAYVVNTGTTGTRNLQIIATPTSNAGRIYITDFDVQQPTTRAAGIPVSVAMNYAVSGEAETHILVRDSRGRTVRQLEPPTRAVGSPNTGTVVWDLRDEKGVVMPSGVYSLELNAITTDGQRTRQTRTLSLIR